MNMGLAAAYNTNDKDPDTLTFNEAMKDDNKVIWIEAAVAEVRSLEDENSWDEVPISDATIPVLPGTWTFRRKRTRDGEVQNTRHATVSGVTYKRVNVKRMHLSSHGQQCDCFSLSRSFWSGKLSASISPVPSSKPH
jgi:hypothetical protein